jgi:hypothetical protein
MRSLIALLMFASAIVAAAAVSPAASPQDRVPFPGLMTQGKIWIQNTGRAEGTTWSSASASIRGRSCSGRARAEGHCEKGVA